MAAPTAPRSASIRRSKGSATSQDRRRPPRGPRACPCPKRRATTSPRWALRSMTEELLQVRDLAIEFRIHNTTVRAVDGVSFRIRPGSTMALVGESGSGKSVISQAIMGILPRAGRIAAGQILFSDPRASSGAIDIARLDPDGAAMRDIRGGRISIIFQEPMTSLSPLHTIGDQIGEALRLHQKCSATEGEERVIDMLAKVGFPNP